MKNELVLSFRNKKQFLIIVVSLGLLIAIPITLMLVRQVQILNSRADFSVKAEFVDDKGNVITKTSNPKVKLKITLPNFSGKTISI